MKLLFPLLLPLLMLLGHSHAFADHYTSTQKTSHFSEIYGLTPAEKQILLYSEFVEPQNFASVHVFYALVQGLFSESDYEMAFVGRGAYKTKLSTAQLTAGFFQNIETIQYLLGSQYTIQALDSSPDNFTFQSSRSLPLVSDLKAQVRMQVLEEAQVDSSWTAMIQNLTGRMDQPQRLVIQDMNHFNKNILLTRMITVLYSNSSGGTDVEVLSASVFYDFPSFGRSFIESSSQQDLEGYAERLHLIGDAFQFVPALNDPLSFLN